jgi:hypothetical protein
MTSAENEEPFAHDDEGNLIAVRCRKCGTVVAVGHSHECVTQPAEEGARRPNRLERFLLGWEAPAVLLGACVLMALVRWFA